MRTHPRTRLGLALLLTCVGGALSACHANPALPPLSIAPSVAAVAMRGDQVAVFAGGCFWGVEGVFEHVKGVRSVTAGYTGGAADTATYNQVSEGTTGHAEAARVVFDPTQVSYAQLLQVYFSVTADPTELNHQGPDSGSQYRSALFVTTPAQRQQASTYIGQLTASHAFARPIVTQVTPFTAFYPAERHHQKYLDTHPDALYIEINDAPKVAALKQSFPLLYTPTSAASD